MVFFLALVAGLADGFGIVMVLPLLEIIDVSTTNQGATVSHSGVSQYLYQFLSFFHLQGSVVAILILITVAFAFKGIMLFGALGWNAYLKGQLLKKIKGRLFDAYSQMDFAYYASRDTGHFINVINEQANRALQSFHAFTQLVSFLISAQIYLILAFLVAWKFGVAILIIGVGLLFLFRWLSAFVRIQSRGAAIENGNLSKLLIESLQALKYLVATNRMKNQKARLTSAISNLTDYEIRTGVSAAFTQAVREPVAVLMIMGIVMLQLIVFDEPLSPILVSIALFYRGMNSVLQVQGYWQNTMEFIGSMEIVHDEFEVQKNNRENNGRKILDTFDQQIRFIDVSFSYGPNLGDVISGVNAEISVRSSVAFVGESGAGKSTMVDMVTLMLKPQRGKVVIDGVDASEVELSSWREKIGYVSQDAVVFDDSIANNIRLGYMGAEDCTELMTRVRTAARRAHLEDFIDSLPNGFDTVVGDRGIRLSGGQRQRLVIARELFRNPSVLILDEATSALDSESELAIQKSIDELKGSLTIIIIAHRLSTIRNVDYIYVFGKGRIIEQGTYDYLKNQRGTRFERFVSAQNL